MSRLSRRTVRPRRPHSSHRSLLRRSWGWGPAREIDAVVVPTNRPITNLAPAVELARELDCPIVVLCSGQSRAPAVEALIQTVRGAAVTVATTPRHPLLALRTHRLLPYSA